MDIYKLFKREKRVTIVDGDNSVEVMIVKPNIGDDEKIAAAMAKARDSAVGEIKDSSSMMNDISNVIGTMSVDERYEYILNNEEPFQVNRADIAPIGDRGSMSEEEIKKGEEDFIAAWRTKRKEEIKKLSDKELEDKIINTITDVRSTLKAGDAYNKCILVYSVKDINHRKLFKNTDDVSKLDDNTYKKLLSETNNFIEYLSQQDVRKVAEDKSFLSSTESEKSTTDSQATKE